MSKERVTILGDGAMATVCAYIMLWGTDIVYTLYPLKHDTTCFSISYIFMEQEKLKDVSKGGK